MSLRISRLPEDRRTFCGFPRCEDLESLKADAAVIGIPYRCPYLVNLPDNPKGVSVSGTEADAPAVLREHSKIYDHSINNYDFDFGGELFAGRRVRVVDCGDLQWCLGDMKKTSTPSPKRPGLS